MAREITRYDECKILMQGKICWQAGNVTIKEFCCEVTVDLKGLCELSKREFLFKKISSSSAIKINWSS